VGSLARNPADAADSPRDKPTPELKKWTADEFRGFLEFVATDPLYLAFLLLATTGSAVARQAVYAGPT
jgi:hypothetical protein